MRTSRLSTIKTSNRHTTTSPCKEPRRKGVMLIRLKVSTRTRAHSRKVRAKIGLYPGEKIRPLHLCCSLRTTKVKRKLENQMPVVQLPLGQQLLKLPRALCKNSQPLKPRPRRLEVRQEEGRRCQLSRDLSRCRTYLNKLGTESRLSTLAGQEHAPYATKNESSQNQTSCPTKRSALKGLRRFSSYLLT